MSGGASHRGPLRRGDERLNAICIPWKPTLPITILEAMRAKSSRLELNQISHATLAFTDIAAQRLPPFL
jgi:hypothetical protein